MHYGRDKIYVNVGLIFHTFLHLNLVKKLVGWRTFSKNSKGEAVKRGKIGQEQWEPTEQGELQHHSLQAWLVTCPIDSPMVISQGEVRSQAQFSEAGEMAEGSCVTFIVVWLKWTNNYHNSYEDRPMMLPSHLGSIRMKM